VRDQLRALAKLAEIDAAARDLEAELESLPQQIDAMRTDVQTLETLLAGEREQIIEAEGLLEARSEDLQLRNEALARAKAKLSQSRNLKEADAAEREVDANRKAIKERQEELSTIRETIDTKRASFDERERQFQEAKTMFEEEESASKSRLEEVATKMAEVTGGREAVIAKIPRAVYKRYERLRTRGKYLAVSVVSDTTCVSCRMALPPQLFIEVQRAENKPDGKGLEDFLTCPQCRAFLVHADLTDGKPSGLDQDGDEAVEEAAADA